ncbi:von Willebrand factor A domain-containing protein 7-like [Patiria miniata]|uniref:von Willebrand factor A domain-containing protein 7-like n=1 Tax=Patiria miniata TaxID=46514 RepID=A0A914BIP5_PATMI|nr:von Willebrand factor A domain-containing protein 7-like [Patiria miniata]
MRQLTATTMHILWVFVATCLVRQSGAFLPSNAGVSLPVTDYTLTDITVQGIVRAVARYFEDTNPDRYRKGDLTGLNPLTPSRLFQRHYGDCVYSTKFERVIKAILNTNIQISNKYSHRAVWHFNGNQIDNGNRKMMGIQDTLLTLLLAGDESTPDYDVARQYCGQFLHMAQSFYSNTNWIELHRWLNENPDEIFTSSELGIHDPLSLRQSPESEGMCQNCAGNITRPELQDCSNNLRPYVHYLTSGYRSGQDVTKPAADPESDWGACSHGGLYDASRTEVATGGINKESSDPRRSPHYTLHKQAALTAIQATEDFFYHPETGLYRLIGEQKFRKLLNLDAGTSLTFVIDVSGSMSDDVAAVKEETIRLVGLHGETCLAASKYVVAPFNDPDYGPVFVTTDDQRCVEYINALTANGGGDCPELANSGLELGVQNSINGANVYVFTDATDKDSEKVPDVLALIEQKEVRVIYLLTGTCSSRRRKRAIDISSVSPSYVSIAAASGGEIYRTDKSGIRELTQIIEGDIRASQVKIIQRTSRGHSALDVDIPVDSTMRELLVSVVGSLSSNTVIIMNPNGMEGTPSEMGANVYTSSDVQLVFSINVTEPNAKGNWLLKLRGLDLSTEYSVKVSANSHLDFTFDILETDATGTAFPIDGKPVGGAEVLLMIQVSAPDTASSVSEIRLHNSAGDATLLTASAEPVTGRTEGIFTASLILPTEPFFVSIVGLDTQGREFLRTQPSEITVVKFKLEQLPSNNTIEDLVPGGNGTFGFRVTNDGPADTLNISVSVLNRTLSSAVTGSLVTAQVSPTSMVLATGQTREGLVTVTATRDVPAGTPVKVTLFVTSSVSSSRNFLFIEATVFAVQDEVDENPDKNDHIAPTCSILSSGGGCTVDQMGRDCQQHTWWVRARAMDDAIVTEVVLDPEIESGGTGKQSLVYENFTADDVTFLYSASCCCPMVQFTVRDGASNNVSCGVDHYTKISGQIDEPVSNGPMHIPLGLSTCMIGVIAAAVIVATLIIAGVLRSRA